MTTEQLEAIQNALVALIRDQASPSEAYLPEPDLAMSADEIGAALMQLFFEDQFEVDIEDLADRLCGELEMVG